MTTALPSRFSHRNGANAVAAPESLFLIATKATNADRPEVLLRGDLADLAPADVRRHALLVLNEACARFPGAAIDVQVLDAAGVPQMIVSAGEVRP